MSKQSVVLILAFIGIFGPVQASDQLGPNAAEIEQRWVEIHDAKLSDLVKKTAGQISPKKQGLVVASLHVPELAKKALKMEDAEGFGIPAQVVSAGGVTVGLRGLYRTPVKFAPGGEHVFLTAEYYDDLDPIHSSSDIYMRIGHRYFRFFHGEGYPHSAKILWLDHTQKESPVFFEVGQYGGGSQVRKVMYALDKDAINAIPDTLYEKPEAIQKEDYVTEKLDWSVWLDGETSYDDLSKDGMIEILNVSKSAYPDELRAKLKEKYGFINTDYITPFRKTLSIYQWDDKKQQFNDQGDYYY